MIFPTQMNTTNTTQVDSDNKSALDSFKRLIKNPIFMFNSFGMCFRLLGYLGYYLFKPKYIEAQFKRSASDANFWTGITSIPTMVWRQTKFMWFLNSLIVNHIYTIDRFGFYNTHWKYILSNSLSFFQFYIFYSFAGNRDNDWRYSSFKVKTESSKSCDLYVFDRNDYKLCYNFCNVYQV